ncbi:unnamed protein product [Didymodactylos carnosus]|uniref:Methyltransferase domain-containing protein n=1 Tax=Didymodactylos carnosus TaxID=1234261 RepID=A0A8S2KGN5_9BILA|nr:unnamed protein product [Didymodactylos carnosus]CAF3849228.1 unnamed protein product [Didymodactylos carnosus]
MCEDKLIYSTLQLLCGISVTNVLTKASFNIVRSFSHLDCQLSLSESDNYFCETNTDWNERKRVYNMQNKRNLLKIKHSIFFLTNWEPNFQCTFERRIGKIGDGGKWVCDPNRLENKKSCLVYSAGSNGDFSFEKDLKSLLPHCEIHTFDRGIFKCPKHVCNYHQALIGNGINGTETIEMLMEKLNHQERELDILKIDIEGSEYPLFTQMFNPNSTNKVYPRQILFEIHIGRKQSYVTHRLFDYLRQRGYAIFHKEPNLIGGPIYFEYAMLRLTNIFTN